VSSEPLSRRELLTGAIALGLGGGAMALPQLAFADTGVAADFADPARNLRNLVRMQGSLREEDVPWWFTGVIFAVVGEQAPLPLLRVEGMEIYWFSHRADGYQLNGNTLTFFRDFETNEFLREFRNPLTGDLNPVKPAVQGGNLGFHYGSDGIWPVKLDGTPVGEPQRKSLVPQWHAMREQVWLQHQTVYPPGMPPMHGQRQSMFAPRRDFLNRRIDALPSVFSSTVFMGWFKWMNMGERPGHLVWHASGAKLRNIDELPRDYLDRARGEFPQRLSAKPVQPAPSGAPPR
jgi:hypothetical protein